jgi:hypothetical protein
LIVYIVYFTSILIRGAQVEYMPGWKVHLAMGFLIYSAIVVWKFDYIAAKFGSDYVFLGLPFFLFATLLPDVDTPASKIRRYVEMGLIVIALLLIWEAKYYVSAIPLFVMLMLWNVKHRGEFHTVVASIVLGLPIVLYSFFFGWSFVGGYLLHLGLDRVLKN